MTQKDIKSNQARENSLVMLAGAAQQVKEEYPVGLDYLKLPRAVPVPSALLSAFHVPVHFAGLL